MPNLKTLGLPLALAAALSGRVAVAADVNSDGNKPAPKETATLQDLLKALDDRLKPLTDDLQKVNSKLDGQASQIRDQVKEQLDKQLRGVADRLQKIETATASLKTLSEDMELLRQSNTSNRMDLEQIKGRLGKLETSLSDQLGQNTELVAQINSLRNKLDDAERRIRESRIVPQPATTPPTPAQGYVVLRNTYTTDVSIRVGGRVYRVPPGQTLSADPQPAGSVTYEVLGIKGPDAVSMAPGQTVTITVYPILP